MAYGRAAPLVAVGDWLLHQRLQPLLRRGGRVLRRPRGRPAHGRQHAGQRPAVDVVERVGVLAAGLHERLLLAGHAAQHAQLQQCAAHRHQFAALRPARQREAESERHQLRFGRQLQQPLAQQPQRDLRIGALQHGAGEAQQHVAAAVVAVEPAHGTGEIGRSLEEARGVAVHLQHPAGLAQEPFAQRLGMPVDLGKALVLPPEQRPHQQGADSLLKLLPLRLPLPLAGAAAQAVAIAGPGCRLRIALAARARSPHGAIPSARW
jgi:hypothetical protein